MKTSHSTVSQLAPTIALEKPRLWEHLLVTQVLADAFEEYTRLDALRTWHPIVRSFLYDTVPLRDHLGLIKERLRKLLWFHKEFYARFAEPMKAAGGPVGTSGDADKIVSVGLDVAEIYGDLLVFRTEIDDERRVYSADFPPLVQAMFEEVFAEISRYTIGECDALRTTFEKYGPMAHLILQAGSRSLMDGGDGGDYKTALTHKHNFSEFDTTKIDSLSMLIDHIASGESEAPDTSGFVYLLTNESMPGMVKIGHTTRETGARVRELSTAAGVPTPFQMVFDLFVNDSALAERKIHEKLALHRVASNREFFKISTSSAIKVIYDVSSSFKKKVSPDDLLSQIIRSVR